MNKKEIRERYKMKPPDMGIYRILNLESGKIYIGRAMDLNGKLNSEMFQLKHDLHMNRELQKDFHDLGLEKFSFEVVDRLAAKDGMEHDYGQELKELEALWLEKLQPFAGNGYNPKKT